jgi:hypothetical protein
MATLNEFISTVAGEGLMRTSRFAVMFNVPGAITEGQYNRNLRKVLLYCDNINLPGITLETTAAKTFGEHREMPYNKLFDTINMGFYVDNSMSVKLLFDNWMGAIQDPVTRNFNYYREYITDIVIDVFDVADKSRYQVTLFQCYPKALNPIQMDYGNKDVMKMTVAMNYKYWTSSATTNTYGGTPGDIGSQTFSNAQNSLNQYLGDTAKVPDTYFTNFNQYQSSYNSFEQGRASLFSSETASVGRGSTIF